MTFSVYIVHNFQSSNSKDAGSKPSRGRYLSACARSGNYEILPREHFLSEHSIYRVSKKNAMEIQQAVVHHI